jgi:glutamate:GABA antiporter
VEASDVAAAKAPAKATEKPVAASKTQFISWVSICFMTVCAVASLRAAPTMATYGLTSIFLYLLPAIVFLIPTALVAAELASGWNGGIYNWARQGISAPMGFLGVWTQFAMTIFYYPTLLAYVATTFAYAIDPALADNGLYTAAVIIIVYWAAVWISLRGIGAIAGLSSGGLIIGTLVPGAALMLLGIVYLLQGNTSAAPMDAAHLFPQWTGIASLVLIVNNFLSYAGMEVNAVHVNDLRNPGKEYPKAMFIASGLVVVVFVLPALAISWVVPSAELSLTGGVMQAFESFFDYFGVSWMTPIVALMLMTASLGGFMAWLAGPSKGLLMIGREEGYLPPFLQKMNVNNVQQNILFAQGILTTVIALLYVFIPSVSSTYWIFSVMTTQIYLIMYVLMFISVLRLRKTQPDTPRGYRVPAIKVVVGVGITSTIAAFLIGFVPPSQFGSGGTLSYVILILLGVGTIGLLVPFLFYKLRKPSWKAVAEAAGGEAATPPPNADDAGDGPSDEQARGRARWRRSHTARSTSSSSSCWSR